MVAVGSCTYLVVARLSVGCPLDDFDDQPHYDFLLGEGKEHELADARVSVKVLKKCWESIQY